MAEGIMTAEGWIRNGGVSGFECKVRHPTCLGMRMSFLNLRPWVAVDILINNYYDSGQFSDFGRSFMFKLLKSTTLALLFATGIAAYAALPIEIKNEFGRSVVLRMPAGFMAQPKFSIWTSAKRMTYNPDTFISIPNNGSVFIELTGTFPAGTPETWANFSIGDGGDLHKDKESGVEMRSSLDLLQNANLRATFMVVGPNPYSYIDERLALSTDRALGTPYHFPPQAFLMRISIADPATQKGPVYKLIPNPSYRTK
jgi:hypothetical protein